jgi:hypothetical protein
LSLTWTYAPRHPCPLTSPFGYLNGVGVGLATNNFAVEALVGSSRNLVETRRSLPTFSCLPVETLKYDTIFDILEALVPTANTLYERIAFASLDK